MKTLLKKVSALTLSAILIVTSLVVGFVAQAAAPADSEASYYDVNGKGINAIDVEYPYQLKPVEQISNLDFEDGFRFWAGGKGQGTYASTAFNIVTTSSNSYAKFPTTGYVSNFQTALLKIENVTAGDQLVVIYDVKGDDANKIRIKVEQEYVKSIAVYDETTGLNTTTKSDGITLINVTPGVPRTLVGTAVASSDFAVNLKGNGWTTRITPTDYEVAAPSTGSAYTSDPIADAYYIKLLVSCGDSGVVAGDIIDAAIDNIRIAKVSNEIYTNVVTGEVIYDPANPPEPPVDNGEEEEPIVEPNPPKNLNFSNGFKYWTGETSIYSVENGVLKVNDTYISGSWRWLKKQAFNIPNAVEGTTVELSFDVAFEDGLPSMDGHENQEGTLNSTVGYKILDTYLADASIVDEADRRNSSLDETHALRDRVFRNEVFYNEEGTVTLGPITVTDPAQEFDFWISCGNSSKKTWEVTNITITVTHPDGTVEVYPSEDEDDDTISVQPDKTVFESYYGTEANGFESSYSSYPHPLKPLEGIYNLDFSKGFICWSGRIASVYPDYRSTYASDSFKLVDTGTNKYITMRDEGYVDTMRTALFKTYNVNVGDELVVIYDAKGADATKLRIMLYQEHIRSVTYHETTGLNTTPINASPGTPTVLVGSATEPSKFYAQLGSLGWDTYIAPNSNTIVDPTTVTSTNPPTSDIYLQVMVTRDSDNVAVGDQLDAAIDNIRIAKVVNGVYYDVATNEVIYDPANPPVKPTVSADSLAWLIGLILAGDLDEREADFNDDAAVNLLDVVYLKKALVDLANSELPITGPMHAARTEDVYSGNVVRYELNDECMGYYFTPKEPGNYQTIILMHGQGNVENFKQRLLTYFNRWVKAGYIEPMVVVMPEVLMTYAPGQSATESEIEDFQYYIYASKPNRFSALLTSIETGALSSKIDTSKKPFVAGFSMGGMAALHAGAEYNTRISQIGALSPAKAFYLGDGKWGIYNYASDIKFSSDPDAHVYLSAGEAEVDFEGKPSFVESIYRFEAGIKVNNADKLTTFIAPSSWGGHAYPLAQKEIFMFLHLASYGRLPTIDLVESVCNNSEVFTAPNVVYTAEDEHK